MHRGFSLVELSIVLVILGLLVGGILAGRSLIRASELRAVTTEFDRYRTATLAFKDKYFALPGDFPHATRVWGRLQNHSTCPTNSSAAVVASGVCDGNGDGQIDGWSGAPNYSAGGFQFWRQLAKAGLIEGEYTGIAGTAAGHDHLLGTNHPASKLANSGWSAQYITSDGYLYSTQYGNVLRFGGVIAGTAPYGQVLRPEELWNIDTKIDDGRPAYGRLIAIYWNICGVADDGTTTQGDLDASYNLDDNRLLCAAVFRNIF